MKQPVGLPNKHKSKSHNRNGFIYPAIIFFFAFLFYANTISNDFALDDLIVITGNQFTQKGFAGLGDIMTHDAFVGAYGEALNLSGGRYRPLSIVSFAIEKSVFGNRAGVYHFFNVLSFAITCVLIYVLLRKLLHSQNEWIPFVTALLFAIHPIHSEVVANIKSRDEIYALLFSVAGFILLIQNNKTGSVFAAILFFLALLSKENAITFLLLIPLGLFLFLDIKPVAIIKKTIPLFAVTLLYLFLRAKYAGMVGDRITTDIMDNNYLHADMMQKLATITQIQLKYLALLVFPVPLSYDYSYNQFPLVTWSNLQSVLSLLIHIGFIAAAIISYKKNAIISYAVVFYFATFSIVSNLVFNIGTSMAERFAFLPSFGFCLAIAVLLSQWFKINLRGQLHFKPAIYFIGAAIFTGAAFVTIPRNKEWKDNYSLYKADVYKVPNSARARLYYGIECISQYNHGNKDVNLINEAIKHIRIACGINPDFHYAFHNLGVAYQTINKWTESVACYNRVLQLMPDNEQAYYGLGLAYGKGLNQPDQAIPYFKKLLFEYKKTVPDYYESLGLCYALKQDFSNALGYFRSGIQSNPGSAKLYYNAAITFMNMGMADSADVYFNNAMLYDATLTNPLRK